jgi:competence protein ComEC
MITKLFHRKTNVLSNIYLTAILVLLFDENYLFDLGFQLSFTVVTAIVVISKNLDYVFNKPIFTYFYRAFLTSYSAFIGSTILVLDAFSIIVPGAILINIIVIPFCFILLIIILSFLGISTIFQLNLLKEILFELKTFLDSIIGLLNLNQVSYFEINLNNNLHSFYHLVYPITFSLYRFYFKNIWITIFIIFFILPLILMLMI